MRNTFPTLVVLAGGESSRLWPLQEKSLLRFLGRPLLELQLEAYIELGFKNILVVCNPDNRDPIQDILSRVAQDAKCETFVQEQARGMGDALLTIEPILSHAESPMPVYICQVHDIFDRSLHRKMLDTFLTQPHSALLAAYEVDYYFPGGYLICDKELNITGIIEKPRPGEEPSNLVNIVAHLHPDLKQLLENISLEYAHGATSDDHYERAMGRMMGTMPFKAVPYDGIWHPIKYPWHVLGAMEYYLDQVEYCVADDVKIEEGVHITGPVYIEQGVRVLHGADIRGPVYIGANTLIGQNTSIRQSMISQDCIVGVESEVNRSYLGRGARLHDGKALDAILADNAGPDQHTNLSAGMITANFRTDAGTVQSVVKGQKIDTGLNKLGAIIGAGAFIGVGAMLMPGVKIGQNSVIGPLTLVTEDVSDNTLYYSQPEIVRKELS